MAWCWGDECFEGVLGVGAWGWGCGTGRRCVGERRAPVDAHGAGCYAVMVVVACALLGGCASGVSLGSECIDGDGAQWRVQRVGCEWCA